MKKILIAIIPAIMLMAPNIYAAGSCTETTKNYIGGATVISLACTGDASDGSIPIQTISTAALGLVQGTSYLYQVVAYPTSGGTAPDAADVTVTMNGQDLLGGKGVNLIHAANTQDTFPYSTFMSSGTVTMSGAKTCTATCTEKKVLKWAR